MLTLKDSSKQYEYMALSNDAWPGDIPGECGMNSILYCLDEDKYYYYNGYAPYGEWVEVGNPPQEYLFYMPRQQFAITGTEDFENPETWPSINTPDIDDGYVIVINDAYQGGISEDGSFTVYDVDDNSYEGMLDKGPYGHKIMLFNTVDGEPQMAVGLYTVFGFILPQP